MGAKLIVKLKKKIYLNDILNIPKYNKISFNKITSSDNPLDQSLIFLKKDIDLKIKKKN